MTVLSFQSLVARPRRRIALARRLGAPRRRLWSGRRTYHDPFFADPAAVEDDSRRMRRRDALDR